MSADHSFRAALDALTQAFDELNAPAMIIGGIAVIAAGVPRETIDIDAAVSGARAGLDETIEALGRRQIVPRIDDARACA